MPLRRLPQYMSQLPQLQLVVAAEQKGKKQQSSLWASPARRVFPIRTTIPWQSIHSPVHQARW